MNGTDVRTIEELRDNFDFESVLGYFANGKLVTWLRDRYYDNEATTIEALSAEDTELNHKIMSALGIAADTEVEELDIVAIQRRNKKLILLRQITDDQEIISHVDSTAFNQDDLYDLLDEGIETIYLCQSEFEVPLTVKNKYYIGLGNPTVKLRQVESVDLNSVNIKFKNVCFTGDVDNQLTEALCEVVETKDDTCVIEEDSEDFEKALQLLEEYKSKLIPTPSISIWSNLFITFGFHGKFNYTSDRITSRDRLVSLIRSHVQGPYEKRRSEVERKSRDNADSLIKYSVYDKVNGNFYYDSIETMNKTLQDLISQLEELGIVELKDKQTLNINYTNYPSIGYQEIVNRLSDDVVKTGYGYSINDYIENYGRIESNTFTEYVRGGLFGGMNKNITTYDCTSETDIVYKMEKDIDEFFKRNCDSFERDIQSYVDRFIQYINTLYLSHLNEIQKMIETQKH